MPDWIFSTLHDPVFWVSFAMFWMTVASQTLIRKKRWQGHAFTLANQVPFAYIIWATGAYGYIPLSAFYIHNARKAIIEWRRAARGDHAALMTADQRPRRPFDRG